MSAIRFLRRVFGTILILLVVFGVTLLWLWLFSLAMRLRHLRGIVVLLLFNLAPFLIFTIYIALRELAMRWGSHWRIGEWKATSWMKKLTVWQVMPWLCAPLSLGFYAATFLNFGVWLGLSREEDKPSMKVVIGRLYQKSGFIGYGFGSQVLLSWILCAIGVYWLSIWIACSLVIYVIWEAVYGLTSFKGQLRFTLEGYKNSGIIELLLQILLLALSFASVHYNIWSLNHRAYQNMSGLSDAIYFSVTTLATVGYGDISPLSTWAKWTCVSEIASGFVVIIIAVNVGVSTWLQRHTPNDPKSEPEPAGSGSDSLTGTSGVNAGAELP